MRNLGPDAHAILRHASISAELADGRSSAQPFVRANPNSATSSAPWPGDRRGSVTLGSMNRCRSGQGLCLRRRWPEDRSTNFARVVRSLR